MSTANPIAQYMAEKALGTVEMARQLEISKGYMSNLKDGLKPISPRVAKQLAKITGRPWWEYMPQDEPA